MGLCATTSLRALQERVRRTGGNIWHEHPHPEQASQPVKKDIGTAKIWVHRYVNRHKNTAALYHRYRQVATAEKRNTAYRYNIPRRIALPQKSRNILVLLPTAEAVTVEKRETACLQNKYRRMANTAPLVSACKADSKDHLRV